MWKSEGSNAVLQRQCGCFGRMPRLVLPPHCCWPLLTENGGVSSLTFVSAVSTMTQQRRSGQEHLTCRGSSPLSAAALQLTADSWKKSIVTRFCPQCKCICAKHKDDCKIVYTAFVSLWAVIKSVSGIIISFCMVVKNKRSFRTLGQLAEFYYYVSVIDPTPAFNNKFIIIGLFNLVFTVTLWRKGRGNRCAMNFVFCCGSKVQQRLCW